MGERDGGAAAGGCFFGVLLVVGVMLAASIGGMGNGGIYQAENGRPVSRLSWHGWQSLDGSSRPTPLPRPTSRPAPTSRPRPTPEPAPTPAPRPTERPTSRPWPSPFPTPAYRSEMASIDDWKAPEPIVMPAVEASPWNPWPWALLTAAVIGLAVYGYRRRTHRPAPAAAGAPMSAPGPRPEEEPVFTPDLEKLTRLLVDALGRLGLAHKNQDGSLQEISISRRQLAEHDRVLLLEVDMERLPHGVRADQLVHPRTLHHLTAVLHRPVKKLNTTGLTYAVLLDQRAGTRPKLPKIANLNEAMRSWPGTTLAFPLGEGLAGPVWETLRGHYLVGGETGSGKTTWLLSTVYALAASHAPERLQVLIVDPKTVDLTILEGLPHVPFAVAIDVVAAAATLAYLVGELEQRQALFAQAQATLGVRIASLADYNERAGGALPTVLAVVDEASELVDEAGGQRSRLYGHLVRLTRLGRSFGINLILADQNPKAEVLSTLIKGNLAGRLSFRVTTPEHSRTILGVAGAEQLPRCPGRFLARLGDGRLHELQGYSLPQQDLDALARLASIGAKESGEEVALPTITLGDGDRRLLRYAKENLGGDFPREAICEGCEIDRQSYELAKSRLAALGYLEKGTRGKWRLSAAADKLDLATLPGVPG